MEIDVYKIKNWLPDDGQECWVIVDAAKSRPYPTLQVYNKDHYTWDDCDGDGFDFHVSDEDIWMPLPTGYEMKEELEK